MNQEEALSNKFLNLECDFSEMKDVPVLSVVVYGRMVKAETILEYAKPNTKAYNEAADHLIYLFENCVGDRVKNYPSEKADEKEIEKIIKALKLKYKTDDPIKPNIDQGLKEGPNMPSAN